jgi:tRNA (mo5U34)-methyltransferase
MQRARNEETTEGIRRLSDELAHLGWYHSIELPDGQVIPGLQTIEQLRERIARYPIPQDLTGKRVLDIGAWDGWFSFEMERRGASVVALDSTRQETFFEARRLLNSKVEYVVDDICRVNPRDLGYFDIVLFFGVLYHLKHPLLALEKVCELTTDLACIESLVTDDPPSNAVPMMEFYESTELAGQFDNWCGPNTSCLLAFCRTAGFVRVELGEVVDYRAHAVGYRKWPEIERNGPAPELVCVENTWTRDHSFSSSRDDYFTAWFNSPESSLHSDNVFVQAGPYACRPVGVRNIGGIGWQANCKLPPGLSRGWQAVTISTGTSAWSNRLRIPVDLSRDERRALHDPISSTMEIVGATDGKTFEPNRVRTGIESCVSVWVAGLPDRPERNTVSLRLDGADLPAVYVSTPDQKGLRQVNAMLPPKLEPGEYLLAVSAGEVESRPVPIRLVK